MKNLKPMIGTWARAFLAALVTCYLTYGLVSWQILLNAGLAAVLPIILRYLTSGDTAYGRTSGK